MTKKHDNLYDFLIIGGGLAGLPLALALAGQGKKVACIDQLDPSTQLDLRFDGRTVALSAGSRPIFEMAGIWDELISNACPIQDIKIMDGGSSTLLEFMSQEVQAEAFGWIIENRLLRKILFRAAQNAKNLTHLAPASAVDYKVNDSDCAVSLEDGQIIRGKLLVGADGRFSWVRRQAGIRHRGWSYHQHAIICTVQHQHPHNHIAVEDFRPEGPFAILPMLDDPESGAHRSSVVWTEHGTKQNSARTLDDSTLHLALNARFPEFYGDVQTIAPPTSYPLGLIHAEQYISQRVALLADAAHAIHPIAGQGLNMGLRDARTLADLTSNIEDPGTPEVLKAYQEARRVDNMGMIFATDSLNKLFSNNWKSLQIARRMGLRAISRLPAAKTFFMKQAMGYRPFHRR